MDLTEVLSGKVRLLMQNYILNWNNEANNAYPISLDIYVSIFVAQNYFFSLNTDAPSEEYPIIF